MALNLVQHKAATSSANATTVAVTVASTGAGNLIVVCAGSAGGGGRTITGVTDNKSGGSNTYVQATNAQSINGVVTTDVWYCLNAGAGVTTVTITMSGAAGTFQKDGYVLEVSGFTTASFDIANNIQGTGVSNTDTGAAVTTTSTKGFVVGVIVTANGITATPAAGNEFSAGGDLLAGNADCSLISTTAATHTPAWTDSAAAGSFTASTAAFKESASGLDGDGWMTPILPPTNPTVSVFS